MPIVVQAALAFDNQLVARRQCLPCGDVEQANRSGTDPWSIDMADGYKELHERVDAIEEQVAALGGGGFAVFVNRLFAPYGGYPCTTSPSAPIRRRANSEAMRGVLAIGDIATGVLALGGMARGVIALGGVAWESSRWVVVLSGYFWHLAVWRSLGWRSAVSPWALWP